MATDKTVSVPQLNFLEWMSQLNVVMRANGFTEKAMNSVSPFDWQGYYEDGYTPEEAFREDMSYA